VKNHNENPKKVKRAIDLVIENGGIEYTYNKMLEYKEKAIKLIAEEPESEAKKALVGLVEYTTTRKK
jgi:octaprenyl-diphosphate synthase